MMGQQRLRRTRSTPIPETTMKSLVFARRKPRYSKSNRDARKNVILQNKNSNRYKFIPPPIPIPKP